MLIDHVNAAVRSCVENLIKAEIAKVKTIISSQTFNRDFKSIHINFGRRTGKTRTIAALSRLNDLVIVHNENSKNLFPPCCAEVKTMSEVIRESRRPGARAYDYVWVDEPAMCMRIVDSHESLYTLDAQLFIKLGE